LGGDLWEEKILKLQKLLIYMEAKKKVPSVINLMNVKKVVVKFPETL
jgi:hypothetical protein